MAIKDTNIIDISTMRPHVNLPVGTGIYCIPMAMVEEWASGAAMPDEIVLRAIIADWMRLLEKCHG